MQECRRGARGNVEATRTEPHFMGLAGGRCITITGNSITKGPKDLKLKFNWDHFSVIIQGLDFGLDRLTAEELADCLSEICPCGQRHSLEYLKKVRTSIKQACDRYSK